MAAWASFVSREPLLESVVSRDEIVPPQSENSISENSIWEIQSPKPLNYSKTANETPFGKTLFMKTLVKIAAVEAAVKAIAKKTETAISQL